MNLVRILSCQAEERPKQLALVEPGRAGREITFEELHQEVGRRAAALMNSGLRRGARVLLLHPIAIPLYIDLLAVIHAGMTAVLIDPAQSKIFVDDCLRKARPDGTLGGWKARLLRCLRNSWRLAPWTKLSETGTPAPLASVEADTPALVTFTSGSTGRPKGVVRTHGLLSAQQRALAKALDHRPGECDLVTLPVFVLANVASGLTSVIADMNLKYPARADPSRIRAQCETREIDRLASSPAFLEALMRSGHSFPTLRKVYTGGAPVFPSLLQRLPKHFPAASITPVYGSTEAEPIAHWDGDGITPEVQQRIGAGGGLLAGRPVPEVEVAIIGNAWGTPVNAPLIRLPAGQPGEIIVSGDHVVGAYLDDEGNQETKIHAEGGVWHRTGDAGYLDAAGDLWLLGRAGEVSRSPGRPETYPLAVEAALCLWPEIARSAFLEEDGKRLLVLQGHSPRGDLAKRIQEALPWAGIDEIVTLRKIPVDRRHNAKIDYPSLRKRLKKTSRSV